MMVFHITIIFPLYRLLDLGFEKDVSSILTAVKKSLFTGIRCQTVLLSATLNEGMYIRHMQCSVSLMYTETRVSTTFIRL